MTTIAEHHASLAAEIRPVLDRHFPGLVHEDLVRDLAALMSGYAARQVEKHARTPQSQKGPGRGDGWAAGKQQRRGRKTA